ncbi:sensor histidine kinase [Brevibacillus sp. SYSU BS000544]|uniref:sensor histidine kinase n=1 Tax=Brevibacillus sp. SYSU BS000544 TaxID=3416443 RepID=UPI003CE47AE0
MSVIDYMLQLLLLICSVFLVMSIIWKLRSLRNRDERGLSKGTLFIIHAVKNDILKIAYLSRQMKEFLQKKEMREALGNLESLEKIAGHMLKKVEHFSLHAESFVINTGSHHLSHLVVSALELIKPLAAERNIELVTEFSHDVELLCDEIHVREVICNLLLNALEAMEHVEDEARIQIAIAKEDEDVLLKVIDSGTGICRINEKSAFHPFFTTKCGKTNFGMGLYYCRCVVEKHNGSINICNNSMKQGTTVVIRFPNERIVRWIYQKNFTRGVYGKD